MKSFFVFLCQIAAPANESQTNKTLTTSQRLELILTSQEQRAQAYSLWEQAFRKLLNEEINDEKYLEIVQDLMKDFQTVSNSMRESADIFDEKNLKKLSKFVRDLQALEKEKMTLTADMQQKILSARPDKHECKHQHKYEHGYDHGDNDSTLVMWRPRLYEEKQKMAECIEQINDLLAEIKELKNDLKSPQQISINGTTITIQTNDDCKTKQINDQ